MVAVVVGLVVLGGLALFIYVGREGLGVSGVGLAALRTAGVGALLLLLINPERVERVAGGPTTVLLDASLSMSAAGGQWQRAVDTARVLAGDEGAVLRFGGTVTPFDTTAPDQGTSRLRDALSVARGRGGETIVITDGELDDAAAVPRSLLAGTRIVRLTRDTVPEVALLDVTLPERVERGDSIPLALLVGTWGTGDPTEAWLEVWVGRRRLLRVPVSLPPPPGVARRLHHLPARVLDEGTHAVRVALLAEADADPRTNERWRVLEVSAQATMVVLVDPADWEGTFLVRAVAELARSPVRGYARTGTDSWRDMRTLEEVSDDAIADAVAGAGLVLLRGPRDRMAGRTAPFWHWPVRGAEGEEILPGDWYLTPDPPSSPIADRLVAVPWGELPPLTGVVPVVPGGDTWVALGARQGRRGVERPVVVGRDSAGTRTLVTTGTGLWRWPFRGGASREAYRALLSAGIDWLLASEALPDRPPLEAAPVVPRGIPVTFRWRGPDAPDALPVTLTGGDTSRTDTLRFDADGVALLSLPPGTYRWRAPTAGARGMTVVEAYSDEFPPGPVTALVGAPGGAFALLERHARERWWLYLVAGLALVGEWAWRYRKGLP